MYNQLLLPIDVCNPPDFSEIEATDKNKLAIKWLENWSADNNKGINFSCLVGSQSYLLSSVWMHITKAQLLPSDAKLFNNWYKIMDKKSVSKCYLMYNPDIIRDERMIVYVFNLIIEKKSCLLFTADLNPNDWCLNLPDLKSRISTVNVLFC